MVSVAKAPPASPRTSGPSSSSSIVAEYSSSNSPAMTNYPPYQILTLRHGPGNGAARGLSGACRDANRLLVRFPQKLDEPAHRRRERPLTAVNQSHRTREIRDGERNDRERACRRLALHGTAREDRHAGRDDDGLLDGLDVVELHHGVDLDVVLPERAVDRLANGQPGVERDERLAVEVGGRDDAAPRQAVVRVAR